MIDWLRQEHIEPEIDLGARALPIILKRHARARRLTLRLAPDGSEVRLTLPRWCSSREALAFVHARQEWLETELAKIPERCPPVPGGTLSYRGEKLAIIWEDKLKRTPQLCEGAIKVGGPHDGLSRRLQRWLEVQAQSLCAQDLARYCERAGVETPRLGISRAHRRWGSCSTGGIVRVNWRLVQAPDYVRHSVVAHEVAHLVHFDHSPAFKDLLRKLFEGDIGTADRWLKSNGRQLYATFG